MAVALPPGVSEEDILLTSGQAMAILQLKESTFYLYIKKGIIPAQKVGHYWRFRRQEIMNLGRSNL